MISISDKDYQRRRYPRLPIVVLCDISDPETGKILGKGCVMNFSRGGLCVVSPAEIPWDRLVNLTVDGLDQEGFVSARVANARSVMDEFYAYGMEFTGLNSFQRVQMERKFRKLYQARLS